MTNKEEFPNFTGDWIYASRPDYGINDVKYYTSNPNPIFKKEFVSNNNENIYLKIACLGYYIIHINDQRVGNFELNNDWTDFSKRIYFDIYDISKYLQKGSNKIEIELGNGMFNPSPLRLFGKYNLRDELPRIGDPTFVLNLIQNGQVLLSTNKKWHCQSGKIKMNNLYLGEHVDYTNINDNETLVEEKPINKQDQNHMVRSFIPKITRHQTVNPKSIINTTDGFIIDFGETISGFFHAKIDGCNNQEIIFDYSETKNSEGLDFETSYAGNIGDVPGVSGGPGSPQKAIQEDIIICRDGIQKFQNKFCYHSFRYVFVKGIEEEKLTDINAIYVHTDLKSTGYIEIDNEFYSKLFDAGMRTKLNNVHSIFEDCARERLSYGGDIVALANSNLYSFDLKNFYKKVIDDFVIEQTEKGGIPETAPYIGIQTNGTGDGEGPILWQLVLPYILNKYYQFYGDKKFLTKYYQAAKNQYDYLMSFKITDLATKCIGDHGSVLVKDFYDETPDKLFVGYCTILSFSILMEKLVKILNKDKDTEIIRKQLTSIKKEIEGRFKNSDGTFGKGTQTSLAFSLLLNLNTEKNLTSALLNRISKDKGIFTTGIFGTAIMYRVLHESGNDEVVANWLKQKSSMSFYNMLKNGNQVLSELFNGKYYSANHAMFSSYIQWYYEALGGIQNLSSSVGFSDIRIAPYFDQSINQMKCNIKTIHGDIDVNWNRGNDHINLIISIPKDINYQLGNSILNKGKLLSKSQGDNIVFKYSITA